MIITKMTRSLKEFVLMRNINKNCLLIVRLVETVKQKLSSSLNQISEQICPFKKSTTAGQQHFTETRYGLFLDLGLSSSLSTSLPLQRLVQLFTIKLCTGWAKS